jgi:hypothetical protein
LPLIAMSEDDLPKESTLLASLQNDQHQ